MKNMGAYENPSRITPVDTGAMSFVKALQQGQMSQQKALEEQERIKQQKDLEQKKNTRENAKSSRRRRCVES